MKALLPKAILLVVGLAVGVGGGIFGSRFVDGGAANGQAKAAVATPAKPKETHAPGMMIATRERIVNLADPGIMRYLKTTVVFEIEENGNGGKEESKKAPEKGKELGPQTPVIEDQITQILSSKVSADIMTNEGKTRLKEEIKAKVNKALGEERVLAVYLTDFIIQ